MTTPDDETRPVRYRAGDSPEHVELPFWLDACIALDPPRRSNGAIRTARHSIYPVARALAAQRVRARGDEAVELNRNDLARWAGYDHARNCTWIFTYLQRIGFLEIHKHYTQGTSGRGEDTFDVFFRPPPNYVGPRSFTELDMALRQQAAGEALSLFFRRSEPRSSREEAGSKASSSREAVGGQNHRSEPRSSREEAGSKASSSREAVGGQNHRSEPRSSREVVPSRVDLFEISEGEIEKRPTESATPPRFAWAGDVAQDDDRVDWARQLVRDLPWRECGLRSMSPEDARFLAVRFRAAVEEHGLSRDDVQAYALDRLTVAKSNPMAWVLGAFKSHRLPRPGYADNEPLSDSPLSLPDLQKPKTAPEAAVGATNRSFGGPEPGDDHRATQNRSEDTNSMAARAEQAGESKEQDKPPASPEVGAAIVAEAHRRREERLRAQARTRSVS